MPEIPSMSVTITGPYELAIVEGTRLVEKIIEGQPPEVKAEIWKRYLEATKPLHDAAVAASTTIGALITHWGKP